MRGKKPKERERYIIRLGNGTLVEVNRDIYLEWYRSERRERYQKERDRKYGVCSLEGLAERGCFFEMAGEMENVTEETALKNIERGNLWSAIRKLPEQDAQMIQLLYYEGLTIKEAAEVSGYSRKTVENKRKKIIRKLLYLMRDNE